MKASEVLVLQPGAPWRHLRDELVEWVDAIVSGDRLEARNEKADVDWAWSACIYRAFHIDHELSLGAQISEIRALARIVVWMELYEELSHEEVLRALGQMPEGINPERPAKRAHFEEIAGCRERWVL